jgi:hypothetical protein
MDGSIHYLNKGVVKDLMSAEQEELITENEAARYLSVTPQRLREFVVQGELRMVLVQSKSGEETMYFRGQVLKLKEKLIADEGDEEVEEWPELIGE